MVNPNRVYPPCRLLKTLCPFMRIPWTGNALRENRRHGIYSDRTFPERTGGTLLGLQQDIHAGHSRLQFWFRGLRWGLRNIGKIIALKRWSLTAGVVYCIYTSYSSWSAVGKEKALQRQQEEITALYCRLSFRTMDVKARSNRYRKSKRISIQVR